MENILRCLMLGKLYHGGEVIIQWCVMVMMMMVSKNNKCDGEHCFISS